MSYTKSKLITFLNYYFLPAVYTVGILGLFAWQYPDSSSANTEKAGNKQLQAKEWMESAGALQNEGLHEEAIELLNKALAIYEEQALWRDFAYCSNSIAYSYSTFPDSAKTLSFADQTIRIGTQYLEPTDTLIGHAYNRKAEFFMSIGEAERSIDNFGKAADIYLSAAAWYDYIFTQIGITVNHYFAGQIAAMEASIDKASHYASEHLPEDKVVNPLIFQWRSLLYNENGDYDKALEVAFQSLNFLVSGQDDSNVDSGLLVKSYNNIGAIYGAKSDLDAALDYYQQASNLLQKLPDLKLDLIRVYANIAVIYIKRNQPQEAISLLEESFQNLSAIAPPESHLGQDYLNYYNHSIKSYLLFGEPAKALELVEVAERVFKDQSLPYKGLINRYMGEIMLAQNNFDQALSSFQKAKEIFANTDQIELIDRAPVSRFIGDTYTATKDYDKALLSYDQTLEILLPGYLNHKADTALQMSPYKMGLFETFKGKGHALKLKYFESENEVHLQESLDNFLLTFDLSDALMQEYLEAGSKQFLLEKTTEVIDEAIEVVLKLYDIKKEEAYLHQAFAFAEKSKAILLAERLQDSKAKSHAGIPDSLLLQEEALKRDLAFYQKKIYDENQKEKPDSLKNTVWQGKVFNLKRALEKHNLELETNYPDYYRQKNRTMEVALTDIQQNLLGDEDRLLEYFVGERNIYLFEISKSDLKVHQIAQPENFEEMALNFRRQIIRPPSADQADAYTQFSEPAFELGQLLLGPILKSNNAAGRLIIIPDEILHFIPFELLFTHASNVNTFANAPYLIRTHTVNYGYSAALLLTNQQSKKRKSGAFRCLAFAPSYQEEGPIAMSGRISRLRGENVALPGAQREVKALSRYFKGDFFFGQEASEQAFKAYANDYEVIHLAMHGSAEEENPMYSRLFFTQDTVAAEDDTLFAYELHDMKLAADLVVLSACETGHGKFVQGEGVMSLASAFIHAGVPSVTMSLWEAQDEATAMIMEHYYQHLSEGKEKDLALREAKLSYLSNSMAQKHPFFWGAFVNVGDAKALPINSSFSPVLISLLLLAGLGSIFFFWRRRQRTSGIL